MIYISKLQNYIKDKNNLTYENIEKEFNKPIEEIIQENLLLNVTSMIKHNYFLCFLTLKENLNVINTFNIINTFNTSISKSRILKNQKIFDDFKIKSKEKDKLQINFQFLNNSWFISFHIIYLPEYVIKKSSTILMNNENVVKLVKTLYKNQIKIYNFVETPILWEQNYYLLFTEMLNNKKSLNKFKIEEKEIPFSLKLIIKNETINVIKEITNIRCPPLINLCF